MKTTKTIHRISIRSAAKVMAGVQGAIGFVLGVLFTIFALLGAAIGGGEGSSFFGVIFGIGAIILVPIFYAIVGFVTGGVMAWAYNKTVKWTGGLRIDVSGGVMEERRPEAPVYDRQ